MRYLIMRVNKSQAILIFAMLILFVAAALITMAPYIKRRIQGSYKQAADVFSTGTNQAYEGALSSEDIGSGPSDSSETKTKRPAISE